eukprot:scaffold4362_cov17-Prasinocladus_malaysianus.AAC.1
MARNESTTPADIESLGIQQTAVVQGPAGMTTAPHYQNQGPQRARGSTVLMTHWLTHCLMSSLCPTDGFKPKHKQQIIVRRYFKRALIYLFGKDK